jgi:hypothetical protein
MQPDEVLADQILCLGPRLGAYCRAAAIDGHGDKTEYSNYVDANDNTCVASMVNSATPMPTARVAMARTEAVRHIAGVVLRLAAILSPPSLTQLKSRPSSPSGAVLVVPIVIAGF